MNPDDSNHTIVQEIVIKAPAARVFEAMTDPAQRVKWWGQERFQATQMESDLRTGGAWLMRGTTYGAKPFTVRGEYRAVDRPRLLEFTWLPDWQEDAEVSQVRIDLDEKDGATIVRLTHSGLTQRGIESHRGWPQILTWLQACVERSERN